MLIYGRTHEAKHLVISKENVFDRKVFSAKFLGDS